MNSLHNSRLAIIAFGGSEMLMHAWDQIPAALHAVTSIITLLLAVRHGLMAVKRKRGPRRIQSKLPAVIAFIILGASLLSAGCTMLHSVTYDPATGQPSTRMSAWCFWDSAGAVSRFSNRAAATQTNEWAPGTYIGNLSGTASGPTNMAADMGILLGTALKAAK